jgi:hypothetical protein
VTNGDKIPTVKVRLYVIPMSSRGCVNIKVAVGYAIKAVPIREYNEC